MRYIEICLSLPQTEIERELLPSILEEVGCDSFMEDETFFKAYCPEESFNLESINNVLKSSEFLTDVHVLSAEKMPDKDWNEIWESSYEPAIVTSKCRIRAPFHEPDSSYQYDLLIEPKMSFGTAHHETTSQIIELMLDTNFKDANVLDMGSGTGVLAILAKKLGANQVVAIDNDEWAYQNALDNIKLNDTTDILVELGDAQTIGNRKFDIILANINRNILLRDMAFYEKALSKNGLIFFSGFYLDDLQAIKDEAEKLKLSYQKHISKNNWTAVIFSK